MFLMRWLSVILALVTLDGSQGSEILMIALAPSRSHKASFIPLGNGLAKRGHNITFISCFPSEEMNPLVKEITPKQLIRSIKNFLNLDLWSSNIITVATNLFLYLKFISEECEVFMSDNEIKHFIASKPHFDLLIVETFSTSCLMGLVHHFKAPFMYINAVASHTTEVSIAGNPTPYSVTPADVLPFSDDMTLRERMINTAVQVFKKMIVWFVSKFFIEPFVREKFEDSDLSVDDIAKNVSFILQVGHPVVTYPRPYLPNVAEIGCIHCRPAKKLPEDLESFISEGGEKGFIYFSLGSVVPAMKMPEDLRQMFVKVFAQLPYKVLWKWDSGNKSMSDLPPNVKLSAWMPQQDILGHPKVRAFITHGGLCSFLETLYHGVPIVVIPINGDQMNHGRKTEKDGLGVTIHKEDITTQSLLSSVNKVIHEPRYRENVRRHSILLRDQPQTPLAKAIYWTEYVIRHDGAFHLQSPSRNMSFIQYYLVDVAAIYLLTLVVVGLLVHRAVKVLGPVKTADNQRQRTDKVKAH